jgi:hypothetical protein
MYELEEGEILGRHAGQGVEVGACPIENPDVVDIVDAASMELEGGFIRETSTEISEKTVCYPLVGAVEDQLIVAGAADESSDPVRTLDVRRELRVDICGCFEDPQHLLMLLDATVDVGIAASHLVKALLLVDHVLKKEDVLILVFGIPAESIDCLAQTFKGPLLAFIFPVVVGVLAPHLAWGADGFFAYEVEELSAVITRYSSEKRAQLNYFLSSCTPHCVLAQEVRPFTLPCRSVVSGIFLAVAAQK